MHKKILFYGINYSPELTGIGKYNSEMINWMVNHGNSCTVVTSYPYYPYWKVQVPYKNFFYKKEISNDNKLTVYRCPLYVPEKPSGLKRIIHDATFFFSSLLIFTRLIFKSKFDYIITIAPPFHIGLIALAYRFIKGGKIIYHIQDLQVDAAKELNLINSAILLKSMFYLERIIIKNANIVSSISEGMIRKIKKKVNREVIKLPNWTDINDFNPILNKKNIKINWGFDYNDFVILYSGNLGEKQGLNIIIDLAKGLKNDNKVKFIICGNGAYKERLLVDIMENSLTNITFFPLQKYNIFNEFLNMADLHLVLQKAGAGDLVMPSKFSTILAVGGLSIVTAQPGTSLYNIVKENKIGLLAIPENVESILDIIKESIDDPDANNNICFNARKYAETNLSIDNVLGRFVNEVLI